MHGFLWGIINEIFDVPYGFDEDGYFTSFLDSVNAFY